jgi:RNA binding exosome subunit
MDTPEELPEADAQLMPKLHQDKGYITAISDKKKVEKHMKQNPTEEARQVEEHHFLPRVVITQKDRRIMQGEPIAVVKKERTRVQRFLSSLGKLFRRNRTAQKLPRAENQSDILLLDSSQYGVPVEHASSINYIMDLYQNGDINDKEKWRLLGVLKRNAELLEPIREKWPESYRNNLLEENEGRVKEMASLYSRFAPDTFYERQGNAEKMGYSNQFGGKRRRSTRKNKKQLR